MKYFKLVWKNMWRSKRRTLLTLFSIAASMFLFCALWSIIINMKDLFSTSHRSLLIISRDKHSTFFNGGVPLYYAEQIRKMPHVTAITTQHFILVKGLRDGDEPLFCIAYSPEAVDWIRPELLDTPKAQREKYQSARNMVLVGKQVADRYNWKIGQTITLEGVSHAVNPVAEIAGIIPYGLLADNVVFRFDYLNEAFGDPGVVRSVGIRVDSVQNVPLVCAMVDENYRNSPVQTETRSEKEFFADFLSSFGPIQAIIQGITLLVLFVTISVTGNAIAMSLRERTREIAIMKSLGFRRGSLVALILCESFLVSLMGGILGSYIPYLLFSTAGIEFRLGPASMFTMNVRTLFLGILVAVTVGLVSGLFPAWRTTRLPIAETIRKTV